MTHDDVFVYDVMSTNDLSVGSAQCLSYVCRGARYHMGHGTARAGQPEGLVLVRVACYSSRLLLRKGLCSPSETACMQVPNLDLT